MLSRLMKQFSGPRGPLGHVAGMMMARMNVPLNTWVVELLEIEANHRCIEVGFGPGVATSLAAARAARGFVAGVDASDVMVGQASRRNRDAITAGRVELQRGTADALPYTDASFDRAWAVNSLQFWPSPERGLSELHRVLVPAGRLVLALRMRTENVGQYDRRRFGFTLERAEAVRRSLLDVGFASVRAVSREVRGEDITALIATK